MKGNTFAIYRNGWGGDLDKLGGVLEATLADFADKRGVLPAALAIHPSQVEQARSILADLDIALDVVPVGGALLGELWLAVPGDEVSK